MKKYLFILLAFLALVKNVFGAEAYPFTVKQTGTGKQAVILIPGFASSADVWNETVEQLTNGHTCYTLNMAGFAGVTAAPGNPDIKNWVWQIARYIEANKIDKPIIIGHSLGGVMAMWLAADYPQLVSKIVVVDALPCLPALSNPGFAAVATPDCAKFLNSFMGMTKEQFYQMQKVTMASMVADTGMMETIIQWSLQSDRNTMALVYCQLLNTDLRAKIKDVKCPTLVMLEPSFKALQSDINEQYKNLKGAQLHYAGKGRHFIMYDDKAWYFAQLKTFVQ